MDFDATVARLERALRDPLPGPAAHLRLVAEPRPGWVPGVVPQGAVPAGVLLLVYPRDGAAFLPLTVRTYAVETHRGQVSLPGGTLDPGETPEEGALREAEEELGIAASEVRVLGRLSPLYIPVSGFVALPVVGVSAGRPSFRPAPAEVAELIETSLGRLAAPGAVRTEEVDWTGRPRRIAFFPLGDHRLWGATAMIIAELLTLLGAAPWSE